MRKFIFLIPFALVATYCTQITKPIEEPPVAKVYDKMLYRSDITHIFEKTMSEKDSVDITRNYIDNWIKEQLLLHKAESSLTEEEKDVKRQLDSYRTSLLIYKFEEQFIKKNLDTVVTPKEIENYYNENQQNYVLDNTIIKALYIKIKKDLPYQDIYNVRRWSRSTKEEDKTALKEYCMKYAEIFDNFDNNWITSMYLQSQIPKRIYNPEVYLRYNKFIEVSDTTYRYFVRIDDFAAKSTYAPLDYVDQKIGSIIVNKRKIELIKKLENSVYNEAMNKEDIKVF